MHSQAGDPTWMRAKKGEMQETHSDWQTYHLYGFTVRSDFPFADLPVAWRVTAEESTADLVFTFAAQPPRQVDWQTVAPLYVEPYYHTPDGAVRTGSPFFMLYELPEGAEVLRFAAVADFYLWPERIVCHLLDPAEVRLAELYLLGTVLAYWAEGRDVATLHASAVVTDAGAVAFMTSSGAGKSSLAASFVQAGYPLLTDDLLAIRYQGKYVMGSAGYPRMRMWPEQAALFAGGVEGLACVYRSETKLTVPIGTGRLGSFCADARPLAAIYLPQRYEAAGHGNEIEILTVAPAEALFTLLSHSFAARLTNTLSRQRQRLALLAPLVDQAPVRRLIYPSGYEYLPRVRQAIRADLQQVFK